MMRDHLIRMATYNRWANRRLYAACEQLSEETYLEPRGMFFGSIHGTLNHLLVADRIWLARIEQQPAPKLALDDRPYADFGTLRSAREKDDDRMIELVESYDDGDLSSVLTYRPVTNPAEVSTPLHLCWLHLFNHQTHHRGQVHGQLSQTEVPPPPLDLMYYLREAA
jgi:uncharacterized damage-inducible protein DinB